MTQTGEARNSGNIIQTNIEPLVDTGSLDLLSNTLDVPLQYPQIKFNLLKYFASLSLSITSLIRGNGVLSLIVC